MNIAVYCGSSTGNDQRFLEAAQTLGEWIGKNGHTLVYGGASKGLMGAVADAVLKAGGRVIGVLPKVILIQERKHPWLSECIETETMAERKMKMIELADAFIALPGGIGTLDEITEVMSLASLGITKNPIVLFDVDGYYQPFKSVLDNIVSKEFGRREYFADVLVSDDMDAIAGKLRIVKNSKES
ncbi:MAG: TIGR00730 family Rossman fold protein [Lachnospiraceae bacterium]|nr:TIGR00730 family Rossman fold protein [Lachnospiraceae bacterium]MBO7634108.1 TIGR00730 family Rossman fold protein [Lachnospiraceae bacterium]